jgi:murein L,D-transpeptidase YcbB/YkuD
LKKLLASYRQLLNISQPAPTLRECEIKFYLKLNQSNDEVGKLKKILSSQGYLSKNDTGNVLNKNVITALKKFQKDHSLDADGCLGPSTSKALNWSLDYRIKKIIANMERLRWLPDHLERKFILINVGGYEALAVRNGKIEHRIKAIVGQKSRKTPLFYAPLKNIILNPSWSVPTSILIKDKLPKIRKDPGYLERAGFTVFDRSGARVDPYQVNWEAEGSRMHLRQSPGAHNALGRIKFNIENPYTIYLHGTPLDKLFKKEARNFSSGCIRLQQPTLLAEWILKDVNGWDAAEIEKKIKTGRTITVPINHKVPVYFIYLTTWVDEGGNPHFSPDAYDLDDKVIEALHIKAVYTHSGG